MLDQLWNGWRAEYVRSSTTALLGADATPTDGGDASAGSVFTRILASGLDDTATHIVHRGARCFAILNAFPYSTGHLLVLPYREVDRLQLLDRDETAELWATVTDAVTALTASHSPEGFNVGLNLQRPAGGSIARHLHVHVVPRWTGDSNFMTTIADTRTLPEALSDTAQRIRNAWPATTTSPSVGS
jgi:ATP adenylyltransferase